MSAPKLYTIAPDRPFVDHLARGIVARAGEKPENLAPENLAKVRVLLPTRRACRSLREAFLRLSDGAPQLLPVMTPLGDVDEDELALETSGLEDQLDLPPAIGATRRVALLARLVMAKDAQTTPDQAVRLAQELARLVDQVHTEGLDLSRLPELVSRADLSEHWQQTVDFLQILGQTWPRVLAELGLMDPARRRDQLLRARAAAWAANPPQTPVIAAGSTGTIPATAELLSVIAHLPQGALVLPGLDLNAPEEVWSSLDASHPQYGMARLLDKLGATRGDVKPWEGAFEDGTRTRVLAHALVPAEATHLWRDAHVKPGKAFERVHRIDAPTPREEAAAIALILRGVLGDENATEKTAALITPDRGLARRVAVELGRWGIEIDDSAGTPLDQTPPGAFFNLVADMASEGFSPVSMLACLKHPLAAGGMEPAALRAAVRALEIALLRGPRPGEGLAGLEDQLRVFLHDPHAARRFQRFGLAQKDIRRVLEMLHNMVSPFAAMLQQKDVDAAAILQHHAATAARLAERSNNADERRLWAGDAGEALSAFISEAFDALGALESIRGDQYPALIQALMANRPVRPRYARHPRLFIWGPLEARLQHADTIILGGLNEGTWPADPQASPWMSRPMMKAFGLPLPERRIGLGAHDFAQAACAPEVYLTRSQRDGGSPQVPSRWLVRLETLLGDGGPAPAPQWLDWAQQLTRPEGDANPCPAPRPTPPVSARPEGLSVTQVETWIRDPYAIYARKVLGLEPLDAIDADASHADRGIVVHTALERFVARYMEALPGDPQAELLKIGQQVFDEFIASPSVRAFWWPRFKRIAAWFATFEAQRRAAGFAPVLIEGRGELALPEVGGAFTLTCQADRIDRDATGALTIIDYKTGQPPTTAQVDVGLTPQLPLEAALARRGAFDGLDGPHDDIAGLLYLRLSGGRVAGEEKPVKLNAGEVTQNAYEGLLRLVRKYTDEKTPYLSRPRPMFERRFGDFDHLARVKEWSGGGQG